MGGANIPVAGRDSFAELLSGRQALEENVCKRDWFVWDCFGFAFKLLLKWSWSFHWLRNNTRDWHVGSQLSHLCFAGALITFASQFYPQEGDVV